jgi:hypothetical protein
VQPVHNQDNGTRPRVVQPAVERVVVPVVGRLPLGLRQGLLGFQRIVDDDDVGAPAGQHAAARGGEPAALRRSLELGHRLALGREAGRKELPVPVAGENMPAIARQFVGEVLRINDAEDLRARIVAETPRRKRHRSQVRLQVARRHIDDHPPDPAGADALELGRGHLEMPVQRERGARVELVETVLRKAGKIGAQQRLVLAGAERFCHRRHCTAKPLRPPPPRLRGEGWGEGPVPGVEKRVAEPAIAPHPGSARKRADSDLSPQAGRGNERRGRLCHNLAASGRLERGRFVV